SWGEMSAQNGLGDVFLRLGNLADANGAYTRALELAERRVVADTANTEWQRDLSVSHEKIGNVLVAQGDGAGAVAAYRKSLAIAEALAARDTANTEWQLDVIVSRSKLGTLEHGPKCGGAARSSSSGERDLTKSQVFRPPDGKPGLDSMVRRGTC